MKSPSDFSTFLDSLDAERGETEELHGWRFDLPMDKFYTDAFFAFQMKTKSAADIIEYLDKRVKILESRTPPDLKESVKAWVLAGMDEEAREAYREYIVDRTVPPDGKFRDNEFRSLCEPESKP